MANRVEIKVSSDVAGAVTGLTAVKAALADLKDESGRSTSVLGTLDKEVQKLGGSLGSSSKDANAFDSIFKDLVTIGSVAAPVFGALVTAFSALAVILPILTVLFIALVDVVGSLVAVVADLVGPFALLTTLLGGLGAAFAYVTMQSFKNKVTMQDQKDALLKLHVAQQTYNEDLAKYGANATKTENALLALHKAQDDYATAQAGVALGAARLDHRFHTLVQTLSKDFSPYIIRGAQALGTFLDYLNKLAKMPLDKAFKDFSTNGVEMIGDFADAVGNFVKHPIRLAFKLAFTSGPMQNMVADWWHDFTGFLFGYSETHRMNLPLEHQFAPITKTHVDGIFQPLIDWFNRHNFTKQGRKIGHDILDGMTGSGAAQRLGQLLINALWDAIKIVMGDIWKLRGNLVSNMQTAATTAANWIKGQLGAAWDWVKNKVSGVWDWIVNKVESVLSINIDWPSPPGWVSSLFGLGGSGANNGPSGWHGAANQGSHSTMTTGFGGGHAPVHNYTIHLGPGSSRQQAQAFMREVNRISPRLAY